MNCREAPLDRSSLPLGMTGCVASAASAATLERLLAADQVPLRKRSHSLTKPGNHCGLGKGTRWHTAGLKTVGSFGMWCGARTGACGMRYAEWEAPRPDAGVGQRQWVWFINRGLYPTARSTGSPSPGAGPTARTGPRGAEERGCGAAADRTRTVRLSAAFRQLKQVYSLARLHVNFFQPVRRLGHGARGATTMRGDPLPEDQQRHGLPNSADVAGGLSLNPLWLSRRCRGSCWAWHGDRVTLTWSPS